MVSIAGLVIADVLASRRGIQDPDGLNRIRIIGAVVGASPLGIIVSDFVAQREAQSSGVAQATTTTPSITKSTKVELPKLVGLDFSEARERLQDLDFMVERQPVAGGDKDKVVKQKPGPGKVAPESLVTLYVGTGPSRGVE